MEFLALILVIVGFFVSSSRFSTLERRIQVLEDSSRARVIQANQQQDTAPTDVSDQLLSYIASSREQGVSDEAIMQALMQSGWTQTAITTGFSQLQKTSPAIGSSAQPSMTDSFGEWLKKDWLFKLGALLLLIGVGWFVSYAFLNNWIGAVGRIILGILLGCVGIVIGWWRMKTNAMQGGGFLVVGSAVILLTTWAARELYDLLTPLSALALMFISCSAVAAASIAYKRVSLAIISVLLAGLAPLFVKAPTTDYVMLFAYLFVVVLGSVWLRIQGNFKEVLTASLVVYLLYSLPHLSLQIDHSHQILLLFAFAFAALFFLMNTLSIIKASPGENISADLITAGLNGFLVLAWIVSKAPQDFESLIIVAWMVVFTVAAFLIFSATQRTAPFYTYACVGIAMLGAATASELSGFVLTIAFTLEAFMIVVASHIIIRDLTTSLRLSLLFVIPVLLSFAHMQSAAWVMGGWEADLFVLLTCMVTMLALGLFFRSAARSSNDESTKTINGGLLIVGSLYFYVIVWLTSHAMLIDGFATMVSLIITTIFGIGTYIYGRRNGRNSYAIYGGTILVLVVARLLLVDVWQLEIIARFVTFFIIGIMLMATAFMGEQGKKV